MDDTRRSNPETPSRPETDITAARRRRRTWDDAALQRALDSADADAWGPVVVLASTGSTNADAAEQVREGAPEGFTVVADEQTVGRGRLDRAWESPSGAGLTMSVVLRPLCPADTWGWLPLIAGIAVVDALRARGVPVALKWPNDVVIDAPAWDGSPGPRKLGGLLVEQVTGAGAGPGAAAVVVGIGVNIDLRADELPVPRATSTTLEGVDVAREALLVDILDHLRRRTAQWQLAAGDARRSGTADAYAARCRTLGRAVRALLPGDTVVEGSAEAIDAAGRLVLRLEDGSTRTVSAGDIEHLR